MAVGHCQSGAARVVSLPFKCSGTRSATFAQTNDAAAHAPRAGFSQ